MFLPILYKRSVTGKISLWMIEILGNKYRTTSGYTDGLKFTGDWTECFGKNKGKSNETTDQEQAQAEARSIWQKKVDLGAFTDIRDIDKPTLFKPMLAHDYKDYSDDIEFPIISQPKLDGVRNVTKFEGMFSRNGKPIISAPHIVRSLESLLEQYPDLILDGELFAEREVCDFNTIISCVRKTKPTLADLRISEKYIQYWIYDVASHPGTFEERYKFLQSLELPDYCVIVPTYTLTSHNEIKEKFGEYIDAGFEGQMLRNPKGLYQNKRSKHLLKHKDFIDSEFEITGYVEGKGKLAGKMGKLIFGNNGFDSAVNGTHDYLAELWQRRDELIGVKATVKYFELTSDGAPRFPKVVAIRDYE
jgi:DNA ligase-1